MRLPVAGVLSIAVAMAVSGCTLYNPTDPTERAAAGAALGAGLGAGLGAAVAISPGLGAAIGAGTGAAIGAAIGVATAPPPPTYEPIPVAEQAAVPGFYDTWPPGYLAPPIGSQVEPPPPG